jgi:hypothetical protein
MCGMIRSKWNLTRGSEADVEKEVATFIKQAFRVIFSFFFFHKIGEQEGRTSPAQWEGLVPVGGGR